MTRLRCLLLCVLAMLCVTDSVVAKGLTDPVLRERQRAMLASALSALAPQRPGVPDLYVVGVGGDSTEDVFRNETAYLDTLMTERFGARGRVMTLINHEDSLDRVPKPLATLENLRTALAGMGALSVKTAMKFETAMAEVNKTADFLTEGGLGDLHTKQQNQAHCY